MGSNDKDRERERENYGKSTYSAVNYLGSCLLCVEKYSRSNNFPQKDVQNIKMQTWKLKLKHFPFKPKIITKSCKTRIHSASLARSLKWVARHDKRIQIVWCHMSQDIYGSHQIIEGSKIIVLSTVIITYPPLPSIPIIMFQIAPT